MDLVAANYELQAQSPAIDTGDPVVTNMPQDRLDVDNDGDEFEDVDIDLEGEARFVSSKVDMGAYERKE